MHITASNAINIHCITTFRNSFDFAVLNITDLMFLHLGKMSLLKLLKNLLSVFLP